MLFPLSLKTLPAGNDGPADYDAILVVAKVRTSPARSKDSREYPSPPLLTAARTAWLHNKKLSFCRPDLLQQKDCNHSKVRAVIYFGKARLRRERVIVRRGQL